MPKKTPKKTIACITNLKRTKKARNLDGFMLWETKVSRNWPWRADVTGPRGWSWVSQSPIYAAGMIWVKYPWLRHKIPSKKKKMTTTENQRRECCDWRTILCSLKTTCLTLVSYSAYLLWESSLCSWCRVLRFFHPCIGGHLVYNNQVTK